MPGISSRSSTRCETRRGMPGAASSSRAPRQISLHKLMAYKDEYEVARLYTDDSFARQLAEQFDGKPGLVFHLASPAMGSRKRAFGPCRWTRLAAG